MRITFLVLLIFSILLTRQANAQIFAINPDHSIARIWNEVLLTAIRSDLARPTVHARNLFHSAVVTYDIWATFDDTAAPWLLGRNNQSGTPCTFTEEQESTYLQTSDIEASQREAISFANYRLLQNRFETSPGAARTLVMLDSVMEQLGYDKSNTAINISSGTPAALGNYLANCMILYGLADGANQSGGYANRYYRPVNPPLDPTAPGIQSLADPNRWQSLMLDTFIDQSGFQSDTPEFITAEWGQVNGFALSDVHLDVKTRDGNSYHVHHDPGPPALLSTNELLNTDSISDYAWGHMLVVLWSAHLDPSDGVSIDISPASQGNNNTLPSTHAELRDFYYATEGGTADTGHPTNPYTGNAYATNFVLRGDYTRVLAEFWADGPNSETPPGHWFSIYNEFVADHPMFSRKFFGEGEPLNALDFDVRAYFLMGAAMHDAAITAWSIKAWYDYIRPLSAIRHLASIGQSTDLQASNYDPFGVPLIPGRIESIKATDELAGIDGQNIGKIKVRAWRGINALTMSSTNTAGVGWILLETWWPYQPSTFVTPPFAGYVSGHSTFSRSAAEILTAITGDAFFPGGMAEFVAEKNNFLSFELGPKEDVRLQWATFRDAADQSGLSRIWGGIHPPVDDIPGRNAGILVAQNALARGRLFFEGTAPLSDVDIRPSGNINLNQSSSSGCSISNTNDKQDPTLLFSLLLGLLYCWRTRYRCVTAIQR